MRAARWLVLPAVLSLLAGGCGGKAKEEGRQEVAPTEGPARGEAWPAAAEPRCETDRIIQAWFDASVIRKENLRVVKFGPHLSDDEVTKAYADAGRERRPAGPGPKLDDSLARVVYRWRGRVVGGAARDVGAGVAERDVLVSILRGKVADVVSDEGDRLIHVATDNANGDDWKAFWRRNLLRSLEALGERPEERAAARPAQRRGPPFAEPPPPPAPQAPPAR